MSYSSQTKGFRSFKEASALFVELLLDPDYDYDVTLTYEQLSKLYTITWTRAQ